MRKPTLLILIAALTLTACAFGTRPTEVLTLQPPQSDLQMCPDELPVPLTGAMTDLLSNHIAVAKAYHQCKDRHNGLVKWLEKTNRD